jgi:enoyl-CoA hydratase
LSSSFILSDTRDGVTTLTINRPEKLNALTWEMRADLLDKIALAEKDTSVHAIIIKGAGRAFCSGADLAIVVDDDPVSQEVTVQDDILGMQRAADEWRRLWYTKKPVIVMVHGYCLGAALEIVLHADFVVASEDATFGYPAVRGSGLPDTQMFLYQIGPQWTKWLLMTGNSIDAATAEHIGLIMKVCKREKLEEEAREIAKAVKQVPLPLLQASKHVVNHGIELMGYGPLQRQNWNEMAMARSTPEVAEFSRIARKQGLKAAMAWRDNRK